MPRPLIMTGYAFMPMLDVKRQNPALSIKSLVKLWGDNSRNADTVVSVSSVLKLSIYLIDMIHNYITVSYLHLKQYFLLYHIVHVYVQIIDWTFRKKIHYFIQKIRRKKTCIKDCCIQGLPNLSNKPKNDKIP